MTETQIKLEIRDLVCWWPAGTHPDKLPNFTKDLNGIFIAEKAYGIHDRAYVDLRVRWIANLRKVVSRRCPKNKVGASLCSDIDLLTASAAERAEALLRTSKRWIDSSN